MSLRLIEVFLPKDKGHKVKEFIQADNLIEIWYADLANHQSLVKILIDSQEAEAVIDQLETHFSQTDGFRILLLSVEAAIPRPHSAEETKSDPQTPQTKQKLNTQTDRINRQELYEDIASTVLLTWTHILMVFLSTIIATIGLFRNNGTILIGAMVIAPLLGPNMALSLATTLGDIKLVWKALKIAGISFLIALSFSIFVGSIFPVSLEIPEIAFRTRVSWSDVILAFASGVAGAVSFTSGATSTIVGVMVAVALLPPLVTFGMLLGSGQWPVALGALLLFLVNLICLNLAGVITFSVQQIRPGKWWETYRAKKLTTIAFGFWVIWLSALLIGILLWRQYRTQLI